MRQFGKQCIDCGSEAVRTTVDEVKPAFRMEIVNYACGAILKTTFSANGNTARAVHSGCTECSGL
ncbi:MAG TPA: hypothetical protein VL949_00290 [Geobacteraceae bacterium]|nr:hypothetical protein [Geobacteraceae bacterium]